MSARTIAKGYPVPVGLRPLRLPSKATHKGSGDAIAVDTSPSVLTSRYVRWPASRPAAQAAICARDRNPSLVRMCCT